MQGQCSLGYGSWPSEENKENNSPAYRHVEVEDPAPGCLVTDHAAKDGSQHRGYCEDGAGRATHRLLQYQLEDPFSDAGELTAKCSFGVIEGITCTS